MADTQFLLRHRKQTLDEHLNLGLHKAVSYLPVKTLETVLGVTVNEYCEMIERAGSKAATFSSSESCVKSGAVFAYDRIGLQTILKDHEDLLAALNWPTSSDDFIRKIATTWYDEDDPVMPVIRAVFGETKRLDK